MTTRPFTQMHSAEDVRTTSDRLGSFFFSESTMRVFDSRLLDVFHPVTPYSAPVVDGADEIAYIVTSEKFEDDPRQYGVRRVRVWRDGDGRDNIEFDRVLVCQLTHARMKEASQRAKMLAQLLAAEEKEGGIDAVNKMLRRAAETFSSVVDTEELRMIDAHREGHNGAA